MVQQSKFQHFIIDYYESSDTNIVDTITWLKSEKKYNWRYHNFPHDINTRDIGTGVRRTDIVHDMGWRVTDVPKISVSDGIQVTQLMINSCWFDAEKTARGLDCLWNYTREWDDRLKSFKEKPLHNWASHGADAFRMMGVTFKDYDLPKDDWMVHMDRKPHVKRAYTGGIDASNHRRSH